MKVRPKPRENTRQSDGTPLPNHLSFTFIKSLLRVKIIANYFGLLVLEVALLGSMAFPAAGEMTPQAIEFFESRIRPVLAQDCYECHRTGGKTKGGLALDYRQALLKGGDSGKAVVPGSPGESLLIKAIRHENTDLEMPKSRARLDASVIADFEEWVRMGAPDPRDAPPTEAQVAVDTDWDAVMKRRKSWWSFQPVRKPELAQLPTAPGANHPVDRFLGAKLAAAHLPRVARADRPTLIRRLSFALRGLPPSPAEILAFVKDPDELAYERLVDSYLSSPRFGETWARHWMDWLRYADSHGSEGDPMIPYAWRYRDYLIRALNADVPYDQLVREHLAGDLLANPRINPELKLNESALGLGHLRMVFHGFAPTDALDEQVRFTDDQISVVSKAFLGMTVSCARCHNHKFDPISQKDYYGWFGIFASCPPAIVSADAPDKPEDKLRANLGVQKQKIQSTLARVWLSGSNDLASQLARPDERLTKAMEAAKDSEALLHPFYLLRQTGSNSVAERTAWWKQVRDSGSAINRSFVRRWNLSDAKDFGSWRHAGPGLGELSPAGGFAVAAEGSAVLAGIYPAGVYSHLVSTKDRAVLLSPRFELADKYDLWLRVAGEGGAMARYVVRNYPRDGTVFPNNRLNGGQWQWVRMNLDYWQGDVIHLELSTAADQPVLSDENATRSWFGLSSVMVTRTGEPSPREVWPYAESVMPFLKEPAQANLIDLAAGYAASIRGACEAWMNGRITDSQALLLDQGIRMGLLPNQLTELPELKQAVAELRTLEAGIRVPVRAQGVIETEPIDQPLFVRGNHRQPDAPVARRFLEAIDTRAYPKNESGRRQLAEDFFRADNPLTSRVIVNRVWHHLFGRGIVATPDNFGRMGVEPTHPELLDYLATWFVEQRYSLKSLIRLIVTTEAWQASSQVPEGASERDPNNLLLSHFNVRRLEAEAVRDALLKVSGDLKVHQMYGPPVNGRKERRSVYVRVKRNELDQFLSAFDAPVPASTTGKRDVTNVPGQSLALLNDPFVHELAEHWAARVRTNSSLADDRQRMEAMFTESLGHSPTQEELERSGKYLQWSATQHEQVRAERAELGLARTDRIRTLEQLTAQVTERVQTRRQQGVTQAVVVLPKALASWDFNQGLKDQVGTMETSLKGHAKLEGGALVLDGEASYVATTPLKQALQTKTLEAWVQLGNLTQQGGGVMSVQNLGGDVFDAIVFGERQSGHWMAGSEGFARSQEFEGPIETEANQTPVHVAMVYAEDGMITCYRNGKVYGRPYRSSGLLTFEAGKSQLLFGNRHGDPAGNKCLTGKLFLARVYDHALSATEIETLAAAVTHAVTEKDLWEAMTESERAERNRLQTELARVEAKLKSLNEAPGLSSEWADLALALFNLKEFIFIR